MSFYNSCKTTTATGSVDLTDKGYHFVERFAGGKVRPVGTAGARVTGVVAEGTIADQASTITVPDGGVSQVILGATVGAGVQVSSNATGQAITAATGHWIAGTTVEGGVAGDIVPVQFNYEGTAA